MITIYDIAKKTGYSATTISKALSGTGTISEKTRAYIREVANEMGYYPNQTARTLSTKQSNLIGVIFEDRYMKKGFSHPLFSYILNSFQEELEEEGYDLIFLSNKIAGIKGSYLQHSKYRNVDGILIVTSAHDTNQMTQIAESDIPAVSVNDFIDGISTVVSANLAGAETIMEYVCSLGHKRIAYISGPINNYSKAAEERKEGYINCHNRHGMEVDPQLIEDANFWYPDAGYAAMNRLLDRTNDFTAVFASNDTLAAGVVRAITERGLRIPEDLTVVGFDGDELSGSLNPPLTTMKQNAFEIGRTAAKLLLQKIKNNDKTAEIIRIPVGLIERSSCARINN